MNYQGVNCHEDVKHSSPDAFKFHGPFKSLVRMILAKVKTPQSWLDDMTGNMAVIRDIYYEYLEQEKQTDRSDDQSPLRSKQDRKTLLSAAIPFSLAISHYDPNYAEVANWIIFRICQEYEAGRFEFNAYHCLPECWYQDEGGRHLGDPQKIMEFMKKYNRNI
jgi:hypothetical protein